MRQQLEARDNLAFGRNPERDKFAPRTNLECDKQPVAVFHHVHAPGYTHVMPVRGLHRRLHIGR
jgi:hypothetical protein